MCGEMCEGGGGKEGLSDDFLFVLQDMLLERIRNGEYEFSGKVNFSPQ